MAVLACWWRRNARKVQNAKAARVISGSTAFPLGGRANLSRGLLGRFFRALRPEGELVLHVPHVTRNVWGWQRPNFMGIEGHVRPGFVGTHYDAMNSSVAAGPCRAGPTRFRRSPRLRTRRRAVAR